MRTRTTPRSRSTLARVWLAAAAAVGVVSLAACATPSGGVAAPTATPTSTPTVSASASAASPQPSPTSDNSTPAPVPTETPIVDAPYNGEVLIVTAEDVDGRLEVTAMVPGVSEESGTCRLDLIDQATSTSITSTAGNDVTYCGIMSVTPPADAAEWRFRVRYESASTRAESAISTVEPTR